MAETKKTKEPTIGQRYEETIDLLRAIGDRDDLVEFYEHQLELYNKKREKSSASTNKQQSALMDTIVEVLAEQSDAVPVGVLMKDDRLKVYRDGDKEVDMTNQRLTSMLTKLVNAGRVVRTKDKKVSYFSLA